MERQIVIVLLFIAWAAGMVGVLSLFWDAYDAGSFAAAVALTAVYSAMPIIVSAVFKLIWPKPPVV